MTIQEYLHLLKYPSAFQGALENKNEDSNKYRMKYSNCCVDKQQRVSGYSAAWQQVCDRVQINRKWPWAFRNFSTDKSFPCRSPTCNCIHEHLAEPDPHGDVLHSKHQHLSVAVSLRHFFLKAYWHHFDTIYRNIRGIHQSGMYI